MAHLYWRGPGKDKRSRKNGKRYPGDTAWAEFRKNGKTVHRSLKTKDPKIAKFRINEIENELAKGSSPFPDNKATIKKVVNDYLDFVKGTIGNKQFTEEKSHLNRLIDTLDLQKVEQINVNQINKFINGLYIKDKPVSTRTKNSYIVTFKKFVKFCAKNNYLLSDPLIDLKQRKLEKNPPFYFDKEQIDKLIAAAKEIDINYYLLIATGYYTGLRMSELLSLEWQNINWGSDEKTGTISVLNKTNFRTKNKTYRIVPFSKQLKDILDPYKKDKGLCFLSDLKGDRANYRTHTRKLEKIALGANITLPKGKKFHILRHSFGTNHGRAGRSIYKLAEWMGHKSVETTKIYSHLEEGDSEINDI